MKISMFWVSITMLLMGLFFGFMENTFYQYLDENGMLVESFFMPLSFLCVALGGLGLLFVAIKKLLIRNDQ